LLTMFSFFYYSTAAINAQAFSARKSPHHTAPNTASRGLSTRKSLSPYLDLQSLPAQSIVKPSLRKSLGGQASRGRTPFDALKSPGMHLARSAIRSAMTHSSAGMYYQRFCCLLPFVVVSAEVHFLIDLFSSCRFCARWRCGR